MWKAFINCWKVKELKNRILFTMGMLALCRLGANIPCPGIDTDALALMFDRMAENSSGSGQLSTMLNLFTGGAMQKFAVAGLGIMPYITASIIFSLLGPVVPIIEKWKREGESGYQKITQWTRYMTLVICAVQGTMFATAMANPTMFGSASAGLSLVNPLISTQWFIIQSVIVLTCGTMLLMWLGEQITEKGIGQGASLIITIGIITRLPDAVMLLFNKILSNNEGGAGAEDITWVHGLILLALFFVVTAAVVALTLGMRKIPIQYARARAGRTGGVDGGQGQASFFPLKVNYAGVMPIIFASTLLMVPGMLLGKLATVESLPEVVRNTCNSLAPLFAMGTGTYMAIYAALILFFCFFWVSSQFNPVKISDDLKRSSAYVPGYRPGNETADYLNWTMTRVTTAGAIFLTLVALMPMLFNSMIGVPYLVAGFFGGTSMLIMVGVMLDTMRQIEVYLVSHGGYESFMKGRVRGRQGASPIAGS
ncbi:preprotein translocase subunit SecY [bacterium M21]|nr:preprotein translocase subunit SecY [bacterium M21]